MVEPAGQDTPAPPTAPPGAPTGRTRAELVADAARIWTSQLIDVGGRNNLLFYRDLRAGTLDLTAVDPLALESLLAGRTVRLSNLYLTEPLRADALKRARTIHAKAKENDEERGISTLYIALGLATWTAIRGTATPAAPILLRPAELRSRGAAQDDFELQATGEMEVNPLLLHTLATDFGRAIDAEALLAQVEGSIDTRAEVNATYDWLHLQADGIRGFSMADRTILGNFLYAKLPMVRDIESSHDTIAAHDLLSAIAGDATARASLRHRQEMAAPAIAPLENADPSTEFLVLDADASQHEAVNRIVAGQDLIIMGPPGTGKSQTIANLIASLLAQGKKVLFVAEKRAAIDAVFKRLDRVGLADMILDIHGGVRSRRALAEELARSLAAASKAPPVDVAAASADLAALRTRVNDTARALHATREPWGVTIYGARARLDELPDTAATAHRFRAEPIRALGRAAFDAVTAKLAQFLELGGLRVHQSAWASAPIDSPDAAIAALDDAGAVRDQLPVLRSLMTEAAAQTGHPEPTTNADRAAALDRWVKARAFVSTFTDGVASADLDLLLVAFAPAAGGLFGRLFAGLLSGTYRAARTEIRARLRAPLTDPDAYAALIAARDLRATWPPGGGQPRPPARLAEIEEHTTALHATLARLAAATGRPDIATLEWPDLERRIADLLRDADVVRKLPDLRRLDREIKAAGFGAIIDEARAAQLSDRDTLARAEFAWLRSVIDEVEYRDPLLATFDAEAHTATIDRFRAADKRHLAINAQRVVRIYAEHAVKARDTFPDEAALVKAQAGRKRGHLPLRELFRKAPNALLAVKPCWAMSPLVVSQMLPGDQPPSFDVVVFDEASQVTPADAVPALMRARRVVVSGDNRQLPPTAFFMAAQPEEEEREEQLAEIAPLTGFESVLDSLGALVPDAMLEWHYRSQDERLIAFSNGAFYGGRLTTFPGSMGSDSLEHVLVNAQAVAAAEESVHEEVREVVRRIVRHAETRPDQSLGVIAMGITHANRISDALRESLRGRPDLDAFFAEDREEPFFVKNLERVQGDERDAIILSIGYGKGADGRVFYRFGPINMEGGERRLNVAVTRARRHMTVISSFKASEMDPAKLVRRGPSLLRDYLAYAESGGSTEVRAAGAAATDGFEEKVGSALGAAGLVVEPHLGSSKEWIDLAVRSPEEAGRFVLAVETDGPAYGAARTARDRDRLRQEQLERLGWAFRRTWSREWETAPGEAIERLVEAAQPQAPAPAAEAISAIVMAPPVGLAAPARGPRPRIPNYASITDYSLPTLAALMTWLESDGLLRTEEEVIDEAMRELGFARHGTRIDAALSQALKVSRFHRGRT